MKKIKLLTPVLLALFYFTVLFYEADKVSITDDARFYMEAGEYYSSYFIDGYKDFKYFEKRFIDKYWHINHEHPPFAKLLIASGHIVFYKWLKILPKTVSLRIGISIMAVIMLLFLFDFTKRAFSYRAAIFASIFFIFLPRTFFHARVATLDFTVAATSFIFIYFYYRGLTSKLFAWLTGIAFGVALASKLNAPFMVVPVLMHYFFITCGISLDFLF